ncbi:MAG: sugar phosphate isomerase/epimerase [Clostridia bacterium]|nr:sugar phosphate isomerase/epimerase [Clostridia bacterium]
MEIGISTASLFLRQYNEDALVTLNELDSRVCEVFLETYSEYTEEYAKLLLEKRGNLKVHSIHTLNTHFEPQLFSPNDRAREDALKIFEDCLKVGKILQADYYTLHGKAKLKKTTTFKNYEEVGLYMRNLTSLGEKYGMKVCLENVEWAYYGRPGFYAKVKEFCPNLCGCLDIKQARESGFDYTQYINEMGSDIKTVHLSDVDENGRIALPTEKGFFDFEKLFKQLKDVGFNGNCLIEVYKDNFDSIEQLKQSLCYLREIKDRIF